MDEFTPEQIELLNYFMESSGKILAEKMGKPDWTYRDFPRMSKDVLDKVIDIIGEDNVIWITFAEYPNENHGAAVRGQALISPAGMQNLKDYKNDD